MAHPQCNMDDSFVLAACSLLRVQSDKLGTSFGVFYFANLYTNTLCCAYYRDIGLMT